MSGARTIGSRIFQKLKTGLAAINIFRRVGATRRLRIRQLQAANAYQLHVIRSLQAEVAAKRAENAAFLKQIKSHARAGPSVRATAREASLLAQEASLLQSAADHSNPSLLLSALRADVVSDSLFNLGEKNSELDDVVCLQKDVEKFATESPQSFQDQVAAYSTAFQTRGYIQSLYEAELLRGDVVPSGVAVDFHPASASTIAPLLSSFPSLSVVATSTAPFELAALLRNVKKNELSHRCTVIASADDRDVFKGEFADFVFGGTILHKLVNPKLLLKRAIETLRPGGRAIFFGPFEDGHAVLRLAYTDIIRDAEARGSSGPGFDFLKGLIADIEARSQRQRHPGLSTRWFDLEDKWLFCKSDLELHCLECGAASVYVRSFNHPTNPFTQQTRSSLQNYAGLAASDALPEWAWNTLRRYDEEAFSQELLHDLVIEGTVVITK